MKQTAVEQLGYAFRKWQKDWDNFEKNGKNKPIPFDEFMKPFLEIEKTNIDNKVIHFAEWLTKRHTLELMTLYEYFEEQYYNETYINK